MNLQCETDTMPGSGVFFEGRNNLNIQYEKEATASSATKLGQVIQELHLS